MKRLCAQFARDDAGGCNMHLSLVGPTIIPGKTPCFQLRFHGMDQPSESEIEGAERIIKEHRNLGNLVPLAAISASFVANEYLKVLLNLPNLNPAMIGVNVESSTSSRKSWCWKSTKPGMNVRIALEALSEGVLKTLCMHYLWIYFNFYYFLSHEIS